jgi:response regulator of citrate/malate metabolism
MSENNVLGDILKEIKKISHQLMTIEGSLVNLHAFLEKTTGVEALEASGSREINESILPTSLDVLNLQGSRPGLFKTYKAIQKQDDWVTSSDIAAETGRSRGLESRYLNYLADKSFILKKRVKVTPESKATEVLYRILGDVE